MSKVVAVGATALFTCILCATPLSVRLSPQGTVALSTDGASAEIGRPLTAGSVAGVHRRAHRRAYRRGYYASNYGTYQPSGHIPVWIRVSAPVRIRASAGVAI